MRSYVAMLAAGGLLVSACGKKAEPAKTETTAKTEPAKTETAAKTEPAKTEPAKTETTAKTEPAKTEPAKVDRAAALQASLEAWSAGDLAKTFADCSDATTYTVVGHAKAEYKGTAAIIDFHTARRTGFTDNKIKALRIFDAGEFQIAEYVYTATHSGALADGTPATNKPIALQGALVMHYGADGKIESILDYADEVTLAQELGLMPGLAEGFQAPKLPETTEVIKGEKNDANKDAYVAFNTKLAPETIEQLVKDTMADDVAMTDLMQGKRIAGKEAVVSWFKEFLAVFPDIKVTLANVVTVGDWVVSMGTSTGTYKGGIPGVEAKDQKVTLTGLDVIKVEGGKFKIGTSYGNGLELLSGLGVPMGGAAAKPPEGGAAGAPGELGIAACDAYLKASDACIEKMPEGARAAAKDALAQMAKTWKDGLAAGAANADATKGAFEKACKEALAAAKQGLGTMCPEVKWE